MNLPKKAAFQERLACGQNSDAEPALEQLESLVAELASPNYVFRLFVSGATPRSAAAIASVRRICEQYLSGRYELEVVDVYQQPEETRKAQIVVAPTLIVEMPSPAQRFIGNMSNPERILVALNLKP